MSDPLLWARTDEQIARVQTAKAYGDCCAACGRQLDPGETVFLESHALGTKRSWLSAPIKPRGHTLAPVGRECASRVLLQYAEDHSPEPCVSCGRGVVDARPRPADRRVTCSRRCGQRDAAARRGSPRPTGAPKAVRGKVILEQVAREKVVRRRAPRPKEAAPERTRTPREGLGARLKRFRESRGMSRADLAGACTTGRRHLGRADIENYEEGRSRPAVSTFAAIARALGVSMEALFYGEVEADRIAGERGRRDCSTVEPPT